MGKGFGGAIALFVLLSFAACGGESTSVEPASDAAGKGGAGGSAGRGGAAGMAPRLPTPCEGEVERVSGSGIMECDNGLVHRPAPGTCPSYEKTTTELPPSPLAERDTCSSDNDCRARAHGWCVAGAHPFGGLATPNHCEYGCTIDVECDAGSICVCTETRGECRRSDCIRDSDCGPERYCAQYALTCSGPAGFQCQSAEDACQLRDDCAPIELCGLRDGRRICDSPQCAS